MREKMTVNGMEKTEPIMDFGRRCSIHIDGNILETEESAVLWLELVQSAMALPVIAFPDTDSGG